MLPFGTNQSFLETRCCIVVSPQPWRYRKSLELANRPMQPHPERDPKIGQVLCGLKPQSVFLYFWDPTAPYVSHWQQNELKTLSPCYLCTSQTAQPHASTGDLTAPQTERSIQMAPLLALRAKLDDKLFQSNSTLTREEREAYAGGIDGQ